MSILIDVIFLAVVLLCVIVGFQKGFVKSLIEFIGYIVSVIGAAYLGNTLSVYLYNAVLRDLLVKKISAAISAETAITVEQKANAIFTGLPKFVTNAMNTHGITAKSLGKSLSGSASAAAPKAADMIAPIIISFTKIILTILIFFLFIMLVRLIAKAMDMVCKLPVLHQMNSLFGSIFGLLKGIIVVMLLCALLQIAVPMLKEKSWGITPKDLNSSYTYKVLCDKNPVYSLFKEK